MHNHFTFASLPRLKFSNTMDAQIAVRRPLSRSTNSRVVCRDATPPPAVLITGASTGIGMASSMRLVNNGWQVFAGVRSQKDADKLASAANSTNLKTLVIDVTCSDTVQVALSNVQKARGEHGLQGLVNNAGIALVGPMESVPVEEQEKLFAVNYFGVVRVSQAFLPLLKQGSMQGRIVNIGSIAGKIPIPLLGTYAASKHALEAFSDSLRMELAPLGVKVSLVEAGPVKTPIWEKGQDSLESLCPNLPESTLEEYGEMINRVEKYTKTGVKDGLETDAVVDVIEDALTSSSPKARYAVGKLIRPKLFLKSFVPDGLMDKMIMQSIYSK